MSLATALTALATQRDNLAANLTTMGVTAANTETLAQLVPKVLNIESGGGYTINLPQNLTNFCVDTFTVATAAQSLWVYHSLGVVPSMAIVLRSGAWDNGSDTYYLPIAIVFGPAMESINAYSTLDFVGTMSFADLKVSATKRNTQSSMEETKVRVSMAGAGHIRVGDYIIITMRW